MHDLSFLLAPEEQEAEHEAEPVSSSPTAEKVQSIAASLTLPSELTLKQIAVTAREQLEEMEFQAVWKFLGSSRWAIQIELDEINEAVKTLKAEDRKTFVSANIDRRKALIDELNGIPARELAKSQCQAEIQAFRMKVELLESQFNKVKNEKEADQIEAQERRSMYASIAARVDERTKLSIC